jgi:hypothetical protein
VRSRRTLRSAGAAASAAAVLLLAGCFGCARGATTLRTRTEVPLAVAVHSDPAGARVFLAATGEEVGRTPCVLRLWSLTYEDWSLIQTQKQDAPRLTAAPPGTEAAYAVHRRPKAVEPGARVAFRIALRLELPGYLPEVVEREVPAEEIPKLLEEPRILLSTSLRPAPPSR